MLNKTTKLFTSDKTQFPGTMTIFDSKEAENIKSEENEMNNIVNCAEMEAEIRSLFDGFMLIGNSREFSLEEVLGTAIIEGERFAEWKNSGRPLTNIRFFHKIRGELIPVIQQYQISFFDSLEDTVEIKIIEDSQFEIWHCEKDNKPWFPLYRIPLSKVESTEKFLVNEKLTDNYSLKVEAKRKKEAIYFTFSICDLSQEISLVKKISLFIESYEKLLQKSFPLFQSKIAFPLILFFVMGLLALSNVQNQNKYEVETKSIAASKSGIYVKPTVGSETLVIQNEKTEIRFNYAQGNSKGDLSNNEIVRNDKAQGHKGSSKPTNNVGNQKKSQLASTGNTKGQKVTPTVNEENSTTQNDLLKGKATPVIVPSDKVIDDDKKATCKDKIKGGGGMGAMS